MVDQTSQFYAILTNVGAAKQANADALGIPWKITQMGVGDANGTDPTPNATQTSLINEWRRAPLNQLKVDDKNSAVIVAEQVIPAEVGGRWIREIALYDADGDMIAVANCAPTYKPLLSQGSGRTQVVRMNLIVSSASNVQLKIDPAVVLATREWVTEELARQDFKHSVLVATTGPITLSGVQTIDGVALTVGARVLVKDQAAAKNNGLYVVAGGAWTRCRDADTDAKVTPGMLVPVEKGQINGDTSWQLVSDGPVNLDVSTQVYEMAFGPTGVVAGTYRSVSVDKYGRVIAASNPTTVAGYGLLDVYTKPQVDAAFSLKADLNSPSLVGTPSAPTAAKGTNNQQLATTAFVQGAVAAVVDSAPEALNTLQELAKALANDPDFATTMTTELAAKQARSEILTGLSALTVSPDKFIYSTGVDSFSLASLSPFVRDLLGSIDAVAVRANVGAAATVHGHGVNDVAGLSEALNAARGLAQGIENQDPNLASDHVIVTNHINTPNPLYYWHITTTFYGLVATTSNRAQLAIQYNDGNAVYARSAYAGQWTNWARLDTGVPAGTVIYTAGSAAPPGFLKANGAAVGRAAYAELYAQIGTNYGAGDGVTTFNVPDLRAEFIRGLDDGRGVDSARLRGSVQMSQNLAHSHAVTVAASGSHTHNLSAVASSAGAHSHAAGIGGFGNIAVGSAANSIAGNDSGVAAWQPLNLSAGEHTHSVSGTALGSGDHSHLVTVAADGGSEGRPRNIALLACIKY